MYDYMTEEDSSSALGTSSSGGGVVVSPTALVTMMMHAARHGTTVVHGILLGTISNQQVTVQAAVPVCHEAPTKPLLDTALALVMSDASSSSSSSEDETTVVGWYTAPERLQDTKPGSAALRIVSGLASNMSDGEPVLVVLQNESAAKCLKGETTSAAESVIKAFGKDFGQQWLEPLSVTVAKEAAVVEAAREAFQQDILVNDLVDHLEADIPSTEWYPNESIAKFMEKY